MSPPNDPSIAWVTGAGKGIGREVARQLAQRGWTVAVSARTAADLDSLQQDCAGAPGSIVPMVLDVTDSEATAAVVSRIEEDLGRLNLVILNAGTYDRFGVDDFSTERFQKQIDLNLMAQVRALELVMPRMCGRGQGRIGVVASVAGYQGLPFAAAYGASKAALINMCESLHPELKKKGVHLSLINPGFIRTPLTDRNEFPMPFLMEVEPAAKRLIDGVLANRFEVVFPTRFAMILKMMQTLPYGIYLRITGKMA